MLGCSHGISGIIGGLLPILVLDIDHMSDNWRLRWVVICLYMVVILAEIMDYYCFYDSNTAYSAHLFGTMGGFFTGLSLVFVYRPKAWKNRLKLVGGICLCTLLIYFMYFYATVWPPRTNRSNYIGTYSFCCASLLQTGFSPCIARNMYP